MGGGSSSLNVTAPALLGVVQAPVVSVFIRLVINPSFEDSTGTNPIPAWTGGSGVQTATGPALDNGIIPDRTQVAVMLEASNTLSQQIYGLAPGKNYWLQFRYNASYSASQAGAYGINLNVKLGGSILATITNIAPAGFSVGDVPFYFTNIVFVPTNASEPLEFDTLPPRSPAPRRRLLLDAVSMVQRDTNEIVIENPDFVASGEAAYPTYVSGQVDGWQIAGGGHGCNSSAGPFLDNGVAPEQGEALFMQGNGTISNAISGPLTVGQVYTLSYSVNRRAYSSSATMTYSAGFGDIPLVTGETLTAVGDSNPFLTEYLIFTNDAPSNVLGFASTAVGDASFLVSAIHLAPGVRIPPTIVSESPTPGESAVSQLSQAPLQFVLAQGSYPLNTSTLQLWLNGTNVAAGATVTTTTNGITITYAYPILPPGTNTVELIVSDKNSPPMTINTTYNFITLPPPELVVSVGAMMDPTAGTVDVGVGFNNTVDNAAGSLLSNYSISSGTIKSLTWCTNRFTADSSNALVMVRKQSALLTVTGLSGGSATLTVKNVSDAYGNAISSTNVAFTVATNLSWGNVGANVLGGWQEAVPVGPGDFDIYSDGIAEWGTYDETTFAYEQVTGDFDKKLRVEYQDGSSEWGRAGIVVRERPEPWGERSHAVGQHELRSPLQRHGRALPEVPCQSRGTLSHVLKRPPGQWQRELGRQPPLGHGRRLHDLFDQCQRHARLSQCLVPHPAQGPDVQHLPQRRRCDLGTPRSDGVGSGRSDQDADARHSVCRAGILAGEWEHYPGGQPGNVPGSVPRGTAITCQTRS